MVYGEGLSPEQAALLAQNTAALEEEHREDFARWRNLAGVPNELPEIAARDLVQQYVTAVIASLRPSVQE